MTELYSVPKDGESYRAYRNRLENAYHRSNLNRQRTVNYLNYWEWTRVQATGRFINFNAVPVVRNADPTWGGVRLVQPEDSTDRNHAVWEPVNPPSTPAEPGEAVGFYVIRAYDYETREKIFKYSLTPGTGTHTCVKCGTWQEKAGELYGDPICQGCIDHFQYEECPACGRFCGADDRREQPDGSPMICSSCHDSRWESCRQCGGLERRGSAALHNYAVHGSTWRLHQTCYENHFSDCETCDRTVLNTDLEPVDSEDDDGNEIELMSCSRCHGQSPRLPDCDLIYTYSYKPKPRFKKTAIEKKPLMFGFELEVEYREYGRQPLRTVTSKLLESLGGSDKNVYLKYDGSVSRGFEIVSHPMSLLYLQENQIFEKLDALRSELKSYTTSTCGFHVHMSKKDFTPYHLYKFQQFQYKHHTLRQTIGQRKDNNYAGVGDQYKGEKRKTNLALRTLGVATKDKSCPAGLTNSARMAWQQEQYRRQGAQGSRYEIINVSPTHTVEMRYFKGNLRADRLYKNIEWLTAVYWFTKDTPESELTVANFKAFLKENEAYYPNLAAFLKARVTDETEDEAIDKTSVVRQPIFKTMERIARRVPITTTEVTDSDTHTLGDPQGGDVPDVLIPN